MTKTKNNREERRGLMAHPPAAEDRLPVQVHGILRRLSCLICWVPAFPLSACPHAPSQSCQLSALQYDAICPLCCRSAFHALFRQSLSRRKLAMRYAVKPACHEHRLPMAPCPAHWCRAVARQLLCQWGPADAAMMLAASAWLQQDFVAARPRERRVAAQALVLSLSVRSPREALFLPATSPLSRVWAPQTALWKL